MLSHRHLVHPIFFEATEKIEVQGVHQWGGGVPGCNHPPPQINKTKFKKQDFVGVIVPKFYMISPSAKISH
jgi:hypothetical protein